MTPSIPPPAHGDGCRPPWVDGHKFPVVSVWTGDFSTGQKMQFLPTLCVFGTPYRGDPIRILWNF